MTDTLRILRDARELIQREGWCQGWYAKDCYGTPTDNPDLACSFCMLGAITRAGGAIGHVSDTLWPDIVVWQHPPGAAAALALAIMENPLDSGWMGDSYSDHVAAWQDYPYRTREQVLSVFDRAIVIAEKHHVKENA